MKGLNLSGREGLSGPFGVDNIYVSDWVKLYFTVRKRWEKSYQEKTKKFLISGHTRNGRNFFKSKPYECSG